jgi:RNA polymerase sigma-70 factor (ECF subfamily)
VPGEDLLIAQSRRGDAHAFDQLVEKYQHRVYDLVYRITGHHADAQDAAQEAFVKAYLGLGRFRGGAAFSTWLHRIAVNAALDLLRRRPRGDLRVPHSVDPAVDPLADGAERVEARERIQRAIATLPIEQRTVVVLRDVQGCSYEEIAMIVQVPVGTVRSRLSRGREALRAALVDLAPAGERGQSGGNRS